MDILRIKNSKMKSLKKQSRATNKNILKAYS
jgi:hypothetical protein